jgi:uracil-DNA glycosylase
MSEPWVVVANTGKRIDLERGFERKSIRCPSNSTAKLMFISTQPGQTIDDTTVDFFAEGRS